MWKSKSNIQIKIANLEQETVSLKNVNFQLRDQYRQKFKKIIQQPIVVYEQLCSNKLPQKCIIHGMSYALYCLTDNKLICSRCMYQNNSHKNHSVKPMNQCLSNISNDLQQSMKQIKQIQKNIQLMSQYTQGEVYVIEKQLPQAKQKIQVIFKNLHQCLFDQQKWCIRQLREYKATMIQQRNLISKQLKNTKSYIEQKIAKHQNKQSVEQILASKSILDALINVPQVLKDLKIDINSTEPKFKFDQKVQENVTSFLKEKFMNLLPWCKQNKEKEVNRPKSSKQKKNNSNKKIDNKLKQPIKKEKNKTQTKIDNSRQEQNSLSKTKQKKQKKSLNLTESLLPSIKSRSTKSYSHNFIQSLKDRRSHLMTKDSLLKKEQHEQKDISKNKNKEQNR